MRDNSPLPGGEVASESERVRGRCRKVATIVAACAITLLPLSVAAQSFPDHKPIEMTVMFGAGSAADVTARQLADGMEKALGAPVPVVNRTGGGGAVGYTHVATQKPDGYSIVWNSNSISTNYHSGILPFDYTAFDAVARVSVEIPALAVRADSRWKTLAEFLDDAKKNPGKFRIGNSGFGSHTHFAAAALFAVVRADPSPSQRISLSKPRGGVEFDINIGFQFDRTFCRHTCTCTNRLDARCGPWYRSGPSDDVE